jgi:AMP-activated protein kinase-like protein
MKMGPVLFLPLAILPPPALAQNQASLGVGAGVVRTAGTSSFSAFTLSPAGQLLSRSFYLGGGGGFSLLAHSAWAGLGRADLWAAYPRHASGPRAALSATIAGSIRSDGVGAASGVALVEGTWGNVAVGVGGITGVIEGERGVSSFRVRARSWWQPTKTPAQISLTVEGTRFVETWYADFTGGVTIDRPRWIASIWGTARVAAAYGSAGAANATLQYFATRSIAIEAAGGNYLRDPFQGLPRAGFFTAGVRVFTSPRALAATRAQARAVLQPLVAQRRGDSVVVRFRMPGAKSVAIAGSWNAWTRDPLRGLGNDIWERAFLLAPGTYYFSLVVNGTDWVVPAGVAVVSDGMGGLVAVLTVL